MQKEGAHISGFSGWYIPKQEEMGSDDLLRFIHDARIEDFHKGRHSLNFSTQVEVIIVSANTPRPDGASAWVVGSEGPFWIVDKGEPTEHRIPIEDGSYVVDVKVNNPPTKHMGNDLTDNSPISICSHALAYMENLVHEAKETFKTEC